MRRTLATLTLAVATAIGTLPTAAAPAAAHTGHHDVVVVPRINVAFYAHKHIKRVYNDPYTGVAMYVLWVW